MTTGGGALSARDGGDLIQKIAEELGGVVRMEDIGRAAAEVQRVQQSRYQSGGLAVGQRDDDDSFGKAVNDSEGLGFASSGETLTLKIHCVAGAGFHCGVGGKESVS